MIEQVLVNLPASLEKRVLVTSKDRPQAIRMAQAYGCDFVELDSPAWVTASPRVSRPALILMAG